MRRNIFVRLGRGDVTSAEGAADIIIDMIDNFGDLDRGLGQLLDRLFKLGARPSEAAVDLMIMATAVYAADTGVSRERYADDGWTRMIDLNVAVSEPGLWRKQQDHLSRMLQFLTGDHWGFTFRDRPNDLQSFTKQPEEMDLTDFTQVSLFSGGLDSLIGAIDLLASGQPLLGRRGIKCATATTRSIEGPSRRCLRICPGLYRIPEVGLCRGRERQQPKGAILPLLQPRRGCGRRGRLY